MNGNIYGLELHYQSDNTIFDSLFNQKVQSWQQVPTAVLTSQKIEIKFFSHQKRSQKKLIRFSDYVGFSNDSLELTHRYLSTTTTIFFQFKNHKLSSIHIYYQPSFSFTVLNKLLSGQLETQLFQNLISLYIEQSVLYQLCYFSQLQCFHAAAVEKNDAVSIFAGLNGVGKSTLAHVLVKNFDYKFFADNYILFSETDAYLFPDSLRLDRKSIRALQYDNYHPYGFGKYTVNTLTQRWNTKPKAKINKIFVVQKGEKWSVKKIDSSYAQQLIQHLQIVHDESIEYAPISQYAVFSDLPRFTQTNFPKCKYFLLTIGPFNQFKPEEINL